MGTKFGLLIGGALGYFFGTKAGRERHQQILEAFDAFLGSETAKSLQASARDVWSTAQGELPDSVTDLFSD
ncbi:YtxH domain-containing protein [Euzebya tangerina]|uniref:YtxH domain-containing protein n=1 Tax=Euzebya tangerina TaxID=591198 RepID=UPI000E3202C7|nr:YtxH domain-containing protein [Euzebya tangerina]